MSAPKPRRPSPTPPEAGNLRAVTHGAFAPSLVAPEAEALVEQVYATFDHLTDRDRYAVGDCAVAQVRVWRLAKFVEDNGDFDARGRLRPAVEALRRWLERAERARARLGLDPASRLSLGVDQALILERLRVLFASESTDAGPSAELDIIEAGEDG